jgi:hypothetical protein
MSEPTDGSPSIRPEPVDASALPPDAPWWARWLDANIREAWRWASMRWSAGVAIIAEVYAANASEINAYVQHEIPPNWWPHIVAAVALGQMVFRVAKLKGDPPK